MPSPIADQKLLSCETYLAFFDQEYAAPVGVDVYKYLNHRDVLLYRVKTYWMPGRIDYEIFPLIADMSKLREVKKTGGKSSEAQKKLNERNAIKKFDRKAAANFTEDDIVVHPTYKGKVPPPERLEKDIVNYLRRIDTYRKKMGLPKLKYMAVIEYDYDEVKSGKHQIRPHAHIIMSGMPLKDAHRIWGKGRANPEPLWPDENGITGLAVYMSKDPKGKRRWRCSKNLIDPKPTVADRKITRRQIAKAVAESESSPFRVFESITPGYVLNDSTDVEVRHSKFAPGAYISVRMRYDPEKWQEEYDEDKTRYTFAEGKAKKKKRPTGRPPKQRPTGRRKERPPWKLPNTSQRSTSPGGSPANLITP